LLGIGMLLGGALAWLIAATRVVLPYDEAFLGLDRDALPSINARLLAFMAHDRVTLAGTRLSLGVLYSVLALWGVRAGAHWAWQAVVGSASVGLPAFSCSWALATSIRSKLPYPCPSSCCLCSVYATSLSPAKPDTRRPVCTTIVPGTSACGDSCVSSSLGSGSCLPV
jgi:hypothetical protein